MDISTKPNAFLYSLNNLNKNVMNNFTGFFQSICFAFGMFHLGTSGGTTPTAGRNHTRSLDGKKFDKVSLAHLTTWGHFIYGNQKLIKYDGSGTLWTSTDGINWSEPIYDLSTSYDSYAFDKVAGKFIFTSQYNVATSIDGVTWDLQFPSGDYSYFTNGMRLKNNKWFFECGFNSDFENGYCLGNDISFGLTEYRWDSRGFTPTCPVTFFNGKLVTFDDSYMWTSVDGVNWISTPYYQLAGCDYIMNNLKTVGSVLVATWLILNDGSPNDYFYGYSHDGIKWKPLIEYKSTMKFAVSDSGQVVAINQDTIFTGLVTP